LPALSVRAAAPLIHGMRMVQMLRMLAVRRCCLRISGLQCLTPLRVHATELLIQNLRTAQMLPMLAAKPTAGGTARQGCQIGCDFRATDEADVGREADVGCEAMLPDCWAHEPATDPERTALCFLAVSGTDVGLEASSEAS